MRPSLHPSWRVSRWAGAAVLGLAVAVGPARAGVFDDDEARRAILDLREQRKKDTDASAASLAAVTAQVEQLRRSLLEVHGQVEALRQELAQQRGAHEVLARDLAEAQRKQKDLQQLDARVARLEPLNISLDGKNFTAEADEKRDFEAALAKLRQADFAGALAGLNALLKRVPTTGYRESSLYWMGNASYGLRDHKECVNTFRTLLALAPQHQRAPEALLSVANCHTELKESKAARKALEDLVKTFPDSEAAQVARERLTSPREVTPPPAKVSKSGRTGG